LVQRQVGDDLLELAILLAQLAQLADLGRAEIAEPLLPSVERLLADPVLPAELDHEHTGVALAQDVDHLLGRELARSHRPVSSLVEGPRRGSLRETGRLRKVGQDHLTSPGGDDICSIACSLGMPGASAYPCR